MVKRPAQAPPPRKTREDEENQELRELDEIGELEELTFDPNLQNLQTVVEIHAQKAFELRHPQRFIEWLTAHLGRAGAFYVLLTGITLWIAYNTLALRLRLPCLDQPPFFWLQGAVATTALLISSMVLITQNRQGKLAARRALLDLHVNLLAEQKVTKLIALLEELRRDLPSVNDRIDPQAEAMSRPVDAQAVINDLEQKVELAIAGRASPLAEETVAESAAAAVLRGDAVHKDS